ncbi:MAG: hypothetical protein OEW24_08215, partial [Chloroflexota bacterium]|nr:hypothetical protein [Chloroflexota bacterium]
SRPDRAFSEDLREQLTSQLPDRRAAEGARDRDHGPRVGWSLGQFFRVPRFVPALVATSLVFAAAVGARELYVAVGNGGTPTPVPSVSAAPSSEPSAPESLKPIVLFTFKPIPTFEPTPSATAVPTPVSTVKPTPKPTPKPDPTPVPTPVVGSLSLWPTTCNGGVVLNWSMYAGAGAFNHYTTLRSTSPEIPAAYPPSGGAVDPGTTYAGYAEKTSAYDIGVDPGVTYYYRTMAFNADDGVIAVSSVASAMGKPVKALGGLAVGPGVEGTQLSWTPYGGSADCFTYYKLAYSETNPFPAYLEGDPYLAAIGDQGAGSYLDSPAQLISGHTYYLRVQAIRSTAAGSFLVAETDVATYLVP